MLMVTSSMRMLNRVHGYSSNFRPTVPLGLVLVVGSPCLQDGFVNPSSSSDDADHSPVDRRDDLLGSGRKLYSGLLRVSVVSNDCTVVARSPSEFTSISTLLFDVTDNGSFRHDSNRKYVSDLEGSLSSTIDELSGVHAFTGNEQLLP